jgi:hypothetical protein
MKLGDNVRLENGEIARIVCDFDNGDFTPEYPESDWRDVASYGLLVVTERGACVQLERTDVSPISN